MNEYRQNAIEYLKTHLGCVGYRDYLIAELEKMEKIEQIVKEWENSKIVTNCYECSVQIRQVLEKGGEND